MSAPKKIMIIEDDEMTIEILTFILLKEGYEVSVCRNGNEALENLPIVMPDLVITDIIIPLKSGLEVINFIKQHFPKMPVIALSGLGEEQKTVTDAFKLGVDDFIAKPFHPEELLLRIKRFL
jgi:DNA-binding response OmpR family regulator